MKNYVLKQMLINKFISSEVYETEIIKSIKVSEKDNKKYQLDYKTDYILKSINTISYFGIFSIYDFSFYNFSTDKST